MTTENIKLYDIAYARSGDKGGNANIGVIAYKQKDYDLLLANLTEEKVADYFASLGVKKVLRYPLPNLWAINFVLIGILQEGGTGLLRIDAQGKALGQA
ncbi:MAG: hypothetical protein AAGG81_04640, partial [Chlamydiota bacterium]